MKDDLVPGHFGRGPFIIDDEDDEDGNGKMWPSWHSNTRTKD